jgi:A/G-specific adenine glycosylase
VIAEVLLQRTRAEVVQKFFPRFLAKYPSWKALARAREGNLREFLAPIGLWRRRADTLRRLARAIRVLGGRMPRDRAEIEALPGVGQYIANAIELLCYGRPRPLLDVNMARVLERFFGPRKLADIRFDPYLQRLAHAVLDREDPKGINWAILDLAALVCREKKPLHAECPLRARCKFLRCAPGSKPRTRTLA